MQVDTVCISRVPELFLFTLMASTQLVMKEFNMSHEPGQPVADFTISLSKTIDVCTLHVRISAGNSAGMSAPSEAVVASKLQFEFCYHPRVNCYVLSSLSRCQYSSYNHYFCCQYCIYRC